MLVSNTCTAHGIVQVHVSNRCFMEFEQLNESGWAKTYLLADTESKIAALIDPVFDFMDSYLKMLDSEVFL